jgi:hypothetical protein
MRSILGVGEADPARHRKAFVDTGQAVWQAWRAREAFAPDDLAARLTALAADGSRIRQLLDLAAARGFQFDD